MAIFKTPRPLFLVAAASLGLAASATHAETAQLLDMSLEELLSLEVTSVSKKSQQVSETTAAVFVVTQDDIHRSGARNIPEALQAVPGLQVAQIDGNKWAISARGSNGRFANKLLVLMNGRTLYTPSFSGVYWDAKDTVMEDIERIEVIRGPGGTLWGSNAVNGVINIITKTAADTQGGFVSTSFSDQSSLSGTARYGGALGEEAQFRVYGKYFDIDGNEDQLGNSTEDEWQMARIGSRLDWQPTDSQLLSLSAEAYTGESGDALELATLTPPYSQRVAGVQDLSGYFVMGHWSQAWSAESRTEAQVYWDVANRDGALIVEDRQTLDVGLLHRMPIGSRHDLVMGAGFRIDEFDYTDTPTVTVGDSNPSSSQWNAYLQDEITLVQDRWYLTLGAKVENNERSINSIEFMPNARLLWNISEDHHAWAAVTRAVRIPSDAELDAVVRDITPVLPPGAPDNPLPIPGRTATSGNSELDSEELIAYELGFRSRLSTRLSADLALFFNDYESLRGNSAGATLCEPSGIAVADDPLCVLASTNSLTLLPFNNDISAEAYGAELAMDWAATDQLAFRGAYSFLEIEAKAVAGTQNLSLVEETSPKHQLSLRSEYSPVNSIDLDLAVRFVDSIELYDISSYWTADLRMAWRPIDSIELELIGKNLLKESRLQFVSEINDITPIQIERSVTATVRWAF